VRWAPRRPLIRVPPLPAKLAIVLVAFAAGVGIGDLFGATNLGTALGVGQLTFAAALVYVLVRPGGR
jgi:hypothetical protein